MQSDAELLAEYAARQSEAAFAQLVERYVALVHSAALRQVGDPHLAEELTQTVFIILARKAGSLGRKTVLGGWLCRTAHFAARDALKVERRRQQREQEAHMESLVHETEPDVWPQIAPLLDEAVAQLSEADRSAVVLRYYQQRPFDEVGQALGVTADTAQKRVTRALEKLRKLFSKRGVTLTATVIAGAVAANSVQAAPIGLSATVAATTAKGAAISTAITALVKGTMKTMTWLKLKFVVGVGAALLAGGVVTVAVAINQNTRAEALRILQQSQTRYDSLSSYSHTGKLIRDINGTLFTNALSVRLERPNLYRLDWQELREPGNSSTNTLWSAGEGDFLLTPNGFVGVTNKLYKMPERRIAMAAIGMSAPFSIPSVFFDMKPGNVLTFLAVSTNLAKQANETLMGVPCHVVTGKSGPVTTTTLWIGKDDFLIHQCRNVLESPPVPPFQMQIDNVTAAAELAKGKKPVTAEAIAAWKKQAQATLDSVNKRILETERAKRDPVYVETHENIQLNQPALKREFIPEIPAGVTPVEWGKAPAAPKVTFE